MRQNIFKFFFILSFVLSVTSVAFAKIATQVSASILKGFEDNLNIKPFAKVGNKLYYFSESKANWFEAFLKCRSMGGLLASFDSQEQFAALNGYMIARYPLDRWWWLSASYLQSEGHFYWYSTGKRINYADWSVGQPGNPGHENCVHLWYKETKYQMNNWLCDRNAHYICEADPPKSIVVSVF